MPAPIRIGAVSYLNTKPLVYQLSHLAPSAKIILDLPGRLADQLADGRLDVALIPSVEYFLGSNYTIVSDACIACRGPVLSVKLYSKIDLPNIETLALDEGSRTSAALVQILLYQKHHIRPRLEPLPIGEGLAEATADAVLLIGDRAIGAPTGDYHEVWDLGDVWCRWSEMPFVFAMWVARTDSQLSSGALDTIGRSLSQARDAGLANLEEIVHTHAAAAGLSSAACLSYLRDNLFFHFGKRECAGLNRFYQLARQMQLVPAGRELKFHDCQTT